MEEIYPRLCQFCETSIEVELKCINCDLFLCSMCDKKIHTKIKSAIKHQKIDFNECGSAIDLEATRRMDLTRMMCTTHEDVTCSLYCSTCEQAICHTCVVGYHRNHILNELDNIYDAKIAQLRHAEETIENGTIQLEQQVNCLQQMQSKAEKNYLHTKTKIQEHENYLNENITTSTQILLKTLDQRWACVEIRLLKQIEFLNRQENDLKTRKDYLEKVLQSPKAREIYNAGCLSTLRLTRQDLITPPTEHYCVTTNMSINDISVGTLSKSAYCNFHYSTGTASYSNNKHNSSDSKYPYNCQQNTSSVYSDSEDSV